MGSVEAYTQRDSKIAQAYTLLVPVLGKMRW